VAVAVIIIAGLIVGSFLNVCIVRIPLEESIVRPGSRCPKCHVAIAWYDNIPVLAYLWLAGRCRSCRESISLRYPLVEVLTAAAFVAVLNAGFEPRRLLLSLILTAAFIVITFIDIDYRIIPDVITLPTIAVAPAVALLIGHISFIESLTGIIAGGGGLWLIAWAYTLVRHQEGMGFGDVKLLAMIGGLQGWEAAVFSLLIGSMIGSLVGIALIVARRGRLDMEIPFGPFLVIAAFVHMLGGPQLIAWYFGG